MRRDLLEYCRPLTGNTLVVKLQTRQIAARPREARHEPGAHRIRDFGEDDRDCAALALHGSSNRRRTGEDDVGLQGDQLFREHLVLIGSIRREADVDTDVAVFRPPELLEPLPECRKLGLRFRIVLSSVHQHADASQLVRLLRFGDERRKGEAADCEPAEKGAPVHQWMISSARTSSDCGMARPSVLAVLRLMTSSNFVGCSTGRSAGVAPVRILCTKPAARRNTSMRLAE